MVNTIRCLTADLCEEVSKARYSCDLTIGTVPKWTSGYCYGRGSHRGRPVEIRIAIQSCQPGLGRKRSSVGPRHDDCVPPLTPQVAGVVFSVGHACLLQYMLLHFTGYEAWTWKVIRQYRDAIPHNMAAAHPEIEFPGIEVTTGPLGQGIANAVGMAIASNQLGAQFNEDGFEIFGDKIWCVTGDGCLQEGISQEGKSSNHRHFAAEATDQLSPWLGI